MVRTTYSAFRRLLALPLALAMLLATVGAEPAAAREPDLQDVPVAVSVLTSEDIEKLPELTDLSRIALLEPGQRVAVAGNYRGINIRGVGLGQPRGLPIGIGTTPKGQDVTTFTVPPDIKAGRAVLEFVQVDGNPYTRDIRIYAFLDAWIERDKLASYQRAQFGYRLDFGDGPGSISVTIRTSGAISYARNGAMQTLAIDRNGQATLTDYVQALKGSPMGTPFSITPQFSRLVLAD